MSRIILPIATLLVAIFAGCTGAPHAADLLLGPVHSGDSFRYEAEDGTVIVVRIGNETVARDRFLSPHQVFVLNYTIHNSERNQRRITWIEEAVALDDGMLVRQVHDCTWPSDKIVAECGNVVTIYYGGGGLPAALGGGPFWRDGSIPRGGGHLAADVPLPRITGLDFSVRPSQQGCVEVQFKPSGIPPAVHGYWYPTTVLYEPATFCPGIPLPVRWRPTTEFGQFDSVEPRPWFTLVERSRGTGPALAWPPPRHDAPPRDPPIPVRVPQGTFLAPNETPLVLFASNDAYRHARLLDPDFDRVAQEGGILITNELTWGPGASCCNVEVYSQRTYIRTLGLQASDGQVHYTQVSKTIIRNPQTGLNQSQYAVEDSWSDTRPMIPPEVAQNASADPVAVLRFIDDLWHSPIVGTTYGFEIKDLGNGPRREDGLGFQMRQRTDGAMIRASVAPALWQGASIASGYDIIADGASGTFLRIDVDREHVRDFS